MKLLFVCQYFYPERFSINDICFKLASEGHEVTVLTGLPNYPDGVVKKEYKKIRYEKINEVNVIRSWLIGRGESKKQLFLNYISFAVAASFKALTIKGDFDKIIVYQLSPVTMAIPGLILKRKLKKPLIIYTFDLWPESIVSGGITTKSFAYKSVKKISKSIYKKSDEVWLSSQMFKTYFNNYLEIQKPMFHLPVYAEDLFGSIGRREKDGKINLLFAGNIGEMQSVETIILAANELKEEENIYFHIVGDGSSKRKCEQLKKDLSLENVIFHGSHPIEDMPYYYSLADAFLITLKNNESISYTLPNKVQSYLAAGKPVIGAINGETAKVIGAANCGFIVEAENFISLANAIREYTTISNKDYLYKNAKDFYNKNYTKEQYYKNILSLLNK